MGTFIAATTAAFAVTFEFSTAFAAAAGWEVVVSAKKRIGGQPQPQIG